jgi:stage III sporulation protein AF
MFEFLRSWITGVVGMVIFMTVIDLILPQNNGFKKYVSLVTGLIVVITILTPVFKLLDRNNDVQATIAKYTEDFGKRQSELDKNKIDQDINKRTMQVFKQNLKASLESEIYKSTGKRYEISSIEVVEDSNSLDYGSIRVLELKKGYADGAVKPVDSVIIGGNVSQEKEIKDEKVVSFLKDKFNVNPSAVKFIK